ncbi:MAG: hypothetical protein HY377_02080, partial [Candidatus Blackburnbacteria bacterium]|nr:hypothetical protein [Candidatus Blackburnbacteria bacterium]
PLLAGGFTAETIGKFIALGFLLATPEAANMVKGFITGQRGGGGAFGGAALGGAIGGAIGAGAAPVGALGRGAWGAAVTRSPIGGWRRAQEARRQEEATIRGRQQVYTRAVKERGGISKEDVERYGLGYPEKKR